jgi:ArsR family transcriptional regulator
MNAAPATTPIPTRGTADFEEELARICKAIGHPVRVRILTLLIECPCDCGTVVDQLPLAQSTVSQHLRVLKEAGLITGEVDGPRRCYGVNPAMLPRLDGLLAQLPKIPCSGGTTPRTDPGARPPC